MHFALNKNNRLNFLAGFNPGKVKDMTDTFKRKNKIDDSNKEYYQSLRLENLIKEEL